MVITWNYHSGVNFFKFTACSINSLPLVTVIHLGISWVNEEIERDGFWFCEVKESRKIDAECQ